MMNLITLVKKLNSYEDRNVQNYEMCKELGITLDDYRSKKTKHWNNSGTKEFMDIEYRVLHTC